jgi:hypothetical protein
VLRLRGDVRPLRPSGVGVWRAVLTAAVICANLEVSHAETVGVGPEHLVENLDAVLCRIGDFIYFGEDWQDLAGRPDAEDYPECLSDDLVAQLQEFKFLEPPDLESLARPLYFTWASSETWQTPQLIWVYDLDSRTARLATENERSDCMSLRRGDPRRVNFTYRTAGSEKWRVFASLGSTALEFQLHDSDGIGIIKAPLRLILE